MTARADDIDLEPLPDDWREPDALLLSPVAGELHGFSVASLGAGSSGRSPRAGCGRSTPVATSPRDSGMALPATCSGSTSSSSPSTTCRTPKRGSRELLRHVPLVALTRGWRGLTLLTRDGEYEVPSLPRTEVDPTGAGDVFAAAFLVRYHESGDPLEAAAFGACAASCAVEGVGASSLGDRDEVLRRLELRERLIEEGEWDE